MDTPTNVPIVDQYAQGFYNFLLNGKYTRGPRTSGELNHLYQLAYRPSSVSEIPKLRHILSTMIEKGLIEAPAGNPKLYKFPNNLSSANKDQRDGRFQIGVNQHIHGRDENNPAEGPAEDAVQENGEGEHGMHTHCPVCNIQLLNGRAATEHRASDSHRLKFLLYWYNKNRKLLLKNSGDVMITPKDADSVVSSASGIVEVSMPEKELKKFNFLIKNIGDSDVKLRKIDWIVQPKGLDIAISDDCELSNGKEVTVKLVPGFKYNLTVTCKALTTGAHTAAIAFQFVPADGGDVFHLAREIIYHVNDDHELMAALMPSSQYKAPAVMAIWQSNDIVRAPTKARYPKTLRVINSLPQFALPPFLSKLLNKGLRGSRLHTEEDSAHLQSLQNLLDCGLSESTHHEYFKQLLYIEEHQQNIDIQQFNLVQVPMVLNPKTRLFTLEVPGLAENRPSVLQGDCIYVNIHNQAVVESKTYEGRVIEVREKDVTLEFHGELLTKYIQGTKFDVRFSFNRFPIRNAHRAIEMAKELTLLPVLFPNTNMIRAVAMEDNAPLSLFNPLLKDNKEQLTAVRNIVNGSSGAAPYVIFGPPGTGKTVTMVESIKQIWKRNGLSKMLVSAPSNAAADLLTERLLSHIPPSQILRFYAPSHMKQKVPPALQKCSNCSDNGLTLPSFEELLKYRIIVATVVNAGRLVSANFPPHYFTHVFIDESGQATEPEMLIAVAGILDIVLQGNNIDHNGQLVISGDPKQLGPQLRSPFAIKYGLGISYLERLMTACAVYSKHPETGYNNRVITMLCKNFRSHPSLIDVPSQLFYGNQLQACGDKAITYSICGWEHLPKSNLPLIFHGVAGKDTREALSPSFFNIEEVLEVVKYVGHLLSSRFKGQKLAPKDIGIISPYRRQVQKIRTALLKKRISGIDVGSTEEFQGQERKVIIISTVRSNPDWLDTDRKYSLGFLCNPKRFNVAITRAKALLIVIGNPNILAYDSNWKALLRYSYDKGGYRGMKFNFPSGDRDSPAEQDVDLLEKFASLKIGSCINTMEPSLFETVEGAQWRGEI